MIPNLNEILEEFAKIVDEIEELVKTNNQEEIQEKTAEVGVEIKEGRKRKRKRGDEGEKKQREGMKEKKNKAVEMK